MKFLNNLKNIISILIFLTLMSSGVKAVEECFEGTSRAIFKFNTALDEAVIEPIAKVTTNYQTRLKKVQVILHQILQLYYRFQTIYYKEILNSLDIQLEVSL